MNSPTRSSSISKAFTTVNAVTAASGCTHESNPPQQSTRRMTVKTPSSTKVGYINPLFAITIPLKTQAYLTAGRPILMAVRGDAADLVKRAQAEMRCNPEDPTAIADALMFLRLLPASERADKGERSRLFYEKYLSFELAADQLEASVFAANSDSGTARWPRRQACTQRSGFLAIIRRRG